MTLPDKFSEWKHLQSVLIRFQNKVVKQEFSDVGEDDWLPDINTPRSSLRVACTLKANDTSNMTLIRLILFYVVIRKIQDLLPVLIGEKPAAYQMQRKYLPRIYLIFEQDPEDIEVPDNQNDNDPQKVPTPVFGQISFRITNQTSRSIEEQKLKDIARAIKQVFGRNSGFVWKKGRSLASYVDKDKGYQLQLLVRDKEDGKRLVEKILLLQEHEAEWKYFSYKESEDPKEAYPEKTQQITILNKRYKEPRIRPIADVYFQYAYVNLWGLKRPIILHDETYRFLNTLSEDDSV